jgi:hypothetical protein
VPTVRASARVALVLLPIAFWLSAWAQPAAACSGGTAPLATGVRGATSIFYARILADRASSVGFHTLRLAVGQVIRGRGQTTVNHLITPRACDSLAVGDFGVVVLGAVNPYGGGPNDLYNFFYVLGPGHGTSAAEAANVLSGLPATDTATEAGPTPSAEIPLLLPVAAGASVGLLALFRLRRRETAV